MWTDKNFRNVDRQIFRNMDRQNVRNVDGQKLKKCGQTYKNF